MYYKSHSNHSNKNSIKSVYLIFLIFRCSPKYAELQRKEDWEGNQKKTKNKDIKFKVKYNLNSFSYVISWIQLLGW